MNLNQRYQTWNRRKTKVDLRSLIKRGFCPIYVLTARYDSPIQLAKARRQFDAFALGLDFVGRMADRNAALAPLNPVVIGTVDDPEAVSAMKIWIDMPVSRFEAPHLRDVPAEIFSGFARCKVDFRAAIDCSRKFAGAVAKARKADCYFMYPAAVR